MVPGSEQPLFQFVHASDPHWGAQTDGKFVRAGERAACFLDDIRRLTPIPKFMVLTGDLASDGNGRANELALAAARLATLPMPTWVVPGNHDLEPGPRRDRPDRALHSLGETNWYRRYGDEGVFWVRRSEPLEFVGFALRNGDPDGVLERLQAHLEKDPLPGHPWRILVGHYPIYHARTGGILASWGQQHVEECIPTLQGILRRHAQSVVAYLFGHIHALTAQVEDGVLHASGGAISVGAPGFRIMSVYQNSFSSRFVPISDPALATYGFWGGDRAEAATDESHPTPEIYHSGLEIEQNFTFDFITRTLRSAVLHD